MAATRRSSLRMEATAPRATDRASQDDAGTDRPRRDRRLRGCAWRRRIRPRLAPRGTTGKQAEHLARPDRGCEDMIANGYTAPSHLAIGGRSAGRITVGRAMTERPDLFAAVVSGVGWSTPFVTWPNRMDMARSRNGARSTTAGYRALKSHRQLPSGCRRHEVSRGAVDHRCHRSASRAISSRENGRAAAGARPAAASRSCCASTSMPGRHRITRAQQDRRAADTYAFILWQAAATVPSRRNADLRLSQGETLQWGEGNRTTSAA